MKEPDEILLRAFAQWLDDYVDLRAVLPIAKQARHDVNSSFDSHTRKALQVFLDVWEPKPPIG